VDNLEHGKFVDKRAEPPQVGPHGERAILEIASQAFDLDDGLHRVVTFLNKSLKSRGLIFGLTRERTGQLKVTIYEVIE